MNNYIIIFKTFAETSSEIVENGDFSEIGVLSLKQKVTFKQLVDLMREYYQPSLNPNNMSTEIKYSTGFYKPAYSPEKTYRKESISFHSENTENAAKYWKWARLAANK